VNGPSRTLRWCGGLLGLALVLRVATLGLYPLTDTTEARYAEMARKMLETGNWLTPMFDVGVPFWGKPPLSFWLSAWPMALLGVGEFTVRLGPLMAALVVLGLMWCWPVPRAAGAATAPQRHGLAVAACLVFMSTPLGFIASAAVMTDMAMVAGTTLSMVAWWRVMGPTPVRAGVWPWLFFIGQAIGLMAKGPVAVVLSGVALGCWWVVSVWRHGWRTVTTALWQRMPWLRGVALTALLVLPWYGLAEQATPGFLKYFIVGEHWYRFTQSGWKGDLYGVAHAQPKGRIWLFALLCTLPWVCVAVWAGLKRATAGAQPAALPMTWAGEQAYLRCWALAPCLFFTMSGNILPAYVLPGLPAFALLMAQVLTARAWPRWCLALLGAAVPLAFTGLMLLSPQTFDAFSDKALLQGATPDRVVYVASRPDSGVFYTAGRARLVTSPAAVEATLRDSAVERVLIPHGKLPEWQGALAQAGWIEQGRNALVVAFRPGRSAQP